MLVYIIQFYKKFLFDMNSILIVDDDDEIVSSIKEFLDRYGFITISANNGSEALVLLSENSDIDLIVVDLVMPIINGIDFCREVRKLNNDYKYIPILMLTTLGDISDKFVGFEAGVDDYLTKPFQPLELLLRVKSLLKRSILKSEYNKENDHIVTNIDQKNGFIYIYDKEISLTNTEFDIFNYLLTNTSKNVTAEELLEKVLGYHKGTGNPAVIRSHIKNIRNKIEKNPSVPEILVNIQGRGYSINLSKVKVN